MKKVIHAYVSLRAAMLLFAVQIFSLCSYAQIPFSIDAVKQVTYEHPFPRTLSNDLEVIFSYSNPPVAEPYFLNLYAKLPTGTAQLWAAENILLDTFSATRKLTYTINLRRLGVTDGTPVGVIMLLATITDTVMLSPGIFLPTDFTSFTVGSATWLIGNGFVTDVTNKLGPPGNLVFTIPPNDWKEKDTLRMVTRGCRVPNIDLDSGANNPGSTPGYAGDWNACTPAACANSMQWLEERFPGKLVTGLSLRKKLEELSKLMKRKNQQGVDRDTMIKAKLEYIDKYKLPIRVKYQSAVNKDSCLKSFNPAYGHCAENQSRNLPNDSFNIDFDWLYNEMKNGEDVEMNVNWVTLDTAKDSVYGSGGHTVVLTGVEEINGVKRIIIKDDSAQSKPGGTAERPITMDSTGIPGLPYHVPEWSSARGNTITFCFITDFVSESYDSTVTFPNIGINSPGNGNVGLIVSANPIREGEHTRISFYLPEASRVRLSVVDINGRRVAELADRIFSSGTNNVNWDGNGSNRQPISSGMYFIILTTESGTRTAKIVKQ